MGGGHADPPPPALVWLISALVGVGLAVPGLRNAEQPITRLAAGCEAEVEDAPGCGDGPPPMEQAPVEDDRPEAAPEPTAESTEPAEPPASSTTSTSTTTTIPLPRRLGTTGTLTRVENGGLAPWTGDCASFEKQRWDPDDTAEWQVTGDCGEVLDGNGRRFVWMTEEFERGPWRFTIWAQVGDDMQLTMFRDGDAGWGPDGCPPCEFPIGAGALDVTGDGIEELIINADEAVQLPGLVLFHADLPSGGNELSGAKDAMWVSHLGAYDDGSRYLNFEMRRRDDGWWLERAWFTMEPATTSNGHAARYGEGFTFGDCFTCG